MAAIYNSSAGEEDSGSQEQAGWLDWLIGKLQVQVGDPALTNKIESGWGGCLTLTSGLHMHTSAPSHAHMNGNRHVHMFKKIKSMAEGQTW